MKTDRIFIVIFLLLLLFYGVFSVYISNYRVKREQEKVLNHAKVVSDSLWSFNTSLAKNYLELARTAHNYKKVSIISYPNEEFITIERPLENSFDRILANFFLIRTVPLKSEIFHKGKAIGEIRVEYYNRSVYTCLYVLLILLLLLVICWFILKTLGQKADLEEEVKNRTSDLENEISRRKKIQQELERLIAILENTTDFVSTSTPERKLTYMNKGGRKLLGLKDDESLSSLQISDVHPEWAYKVVSETGIPEAIKKGLWLGETAILIREGKEVPVSQMIMAHNSPNGELEYLSTIIRDISSIKNAEKEKLKLEEQLRQSQKMDAIGQLAGGVAHDFNNMLMAIMGSVDLLYMEIGDKGDLKQYVDIISEASSQARDLTERLLTFSRKKHVEKVPFDVHKSVNRVLDMLKRSIDKRIEISTDLKADKTTINGDYSIMDNAFLNICINACDAMPEGGKLTINSYNSQEKVAEKGSEECIVIEFKDIGQGIKPEVKDRIFEPFFTTKNIGKGTGLGLSVVYQTINENDGWIDVETELGEGTTMKVYFPIVKQPHNGELKPESDDLVYGSGKILIADDEKVVRLMASKMLNKLGYDIMTAEDGLECLDLYKEKHKEIDLILLDIVMPRMNGKDTFYKLKEFDPDVKVLIASGFSQDANISQLIEDGALGFLKKPFRHHELSQKIGSFLAEPSVKKED